MAICGTAAGATGRSLVSASYGATADPLQDARAGVTAADSTPKATPAATVPLPSGTTAASATVDPGTPSATPTSALANAEPLPACGLGDTLTPLSQLSDWRLTLVDSNLAVPASYAPNDLVEASAAGLSRYFTVRSIMVDDLREMAKAAAAAGARLGITSAYRDYTDQRWTFWYWVGQLGYDKALVSSARPGHSEHQLGLVIDFTTSHGEDPWVYRDFAKETSAGKWLAANAWRYGFIMSYPLNKLAKTCYAYEPWHYRYVGIEEAAAIRSSGLTLREWLWRHQPNPEGMSPMDTPAPTAPPGVPGGEDDGAPSASPRPAGT